MSGGALVLRIVAIVFPVFAVIGVGWLYGRYRRPDMSVANQLNMDLFVPALVFSALAAKSFAIGDHAMLALAGSVVILGSGLIGWPIARLSGIAPKTLVPPMMFKNSGNMGIPLIVLTFGDQALPAAVVLFLVENLLHFSLGAWMLDHRVRMLDLWKNPVMAAGLAGLAVSLGGVALWPPAVTAIRMLGDVSIPLLLFSLGVRLAQSAFHVWGAGLVGALATPAAGLAVAIACRPLLESGQEAAILLLFGALPPAVLNYMFAERYRQEPDKVASIVMTGNVAALAVVSAVLAYILAA
ncbi:MAG TPA: AEC family transporter [Rhodocyclaceae bacterium]|nr:AEC family transporter [Rhodocyclaceae bacterium]HNH34265.1 AEC family transporter [Rhodocyclaceae bacterium]